MFGGLSAASHRKRRPPLSRNHSAGKQLARCYVLSETKLGFGSGCARRGWDSCLRKKRSGPRRCQATGRAARPSACVSAGTPGCAAFSRVVWGSGRGRKEGEKGRRVRTRVREGAKRRGSGISSRKRAGRFHQHPGRSWERMPGSRGQRRKRLPRQLSFLSSSSTLPEVTRFPPSPPPDRRTGVFCIAQLAAPGP